MLFRMFKVDIKKEIIDHCKKQVEKYNFGQRGYADGTKDQQLTGIIGQTVVADLYDMPWVEGGEGFDEGKDLLVSGKVVDIKTMGRTTDVRDYYVNNFVGLQKDYKTDIYIFCSLNKTTNELTICGWVSKKELFERAQFFKKGTTRTRSDGSTFQTFTDLYEIANNALNNVDTVEELKKDTMMKPK